MNEQKARDRIAAILRVATSDAKKEGSLPPFIAGYAAGRVSELANTNDYLGLYTVAQDVMAELIALCDPAKVAAMVAASAEAADLRMAAEENGA
jgi:hypothetical protein